MQRRYIDACFPFTPEAWESLYGGSFSPGVYSGMEVTPGTLGSQIQIASGLHFVPPGIMVEETEALTLTVGGTFPPAVATNYTVCSQYAPVAMGLLGGTEVNYYVTASLLTSHPADGAIIGWIRHPGGSVPLTTAMVTNGPRMRNWELAMLCMYRKPLQVTSPHLVATLGGSVSEASGVDTTANVSWRGFYASGAAPLTPTYAYFHYLVGAKPYSFKLRSVIPMGTVVEAAIYDTAGVLQTTGSFSVHSTFTWDEVVLPAGGTWTVGSTALVKLTATVQANTTLKISDLVVNFWPYGLTVTG